MATQNVMKESEKRILVYLSQVPNPLKYKMQIATKLNIDYVYLNRIMKGLELKGWIKRIMTLQGKKVMFDITELGRVRLAANK